MENRLHNKQKNATIIRFQFHLSCQESQDKMISSFPPIQPPHYHSKVKDYPISGRPTQSLTIQSIFESKRTSNLKFLLSLIIILIFEMQQQQRLGNFITKLHYLLSRQEYSQIIRWDNTNTLIDIISQEKMEKEIIPHFFRHQKYQSFVRQLNLYGFKKVKCSDRHRFTHSQLLKGEGLDSITSHKLKKQGKGEERADAEATSQEKSSKCAKKTQEEERTKPSFLNSAPLKAASEGNTRQAAEIREDTTIENINDQSQQFVVNTHPYFNFWNMFMLQPSNQFAGIVYLNPLQTQQ